MLDNRAVAEPLAIRPLVDFSFIFFIGETQLCFFFYYYFFLPPAMLRLKGTIRRSGLDFPFPHSTDHLELHLHLVFSLILPVLQSFL